MQCFSSDYAIDKTLLQYTPNLTMTHIEDRVLTTHRDVEESGKAIDRSANVLIAAGGPRHFPPPYHHQGDWDGPGKGGIGQQQQQSQGNEGRNGKSRTRARTAAAAAAATVASTPVAVVIWW